MQIVYNYEWIPITEEEYEKHRYKRKNNSLCEIITETLSEVECYRKVPMYEGLQNIIDHNPKYYKYYKRGDFKTYFICSNENYDKLMKYMATLKMCKSCKKVVEVKKTTKYENGCDIITYECPNCGYVETQSINKVHYGNDGLK